MSQNEFNFPQNPKTPLFVPMTLYYFRFYLFENTNNGADSISEHQEVAQLSLGASISLLVAPW